MNIAHLLMMPKKTTPSGPSIAEQLIIQKHDEYALWCRLYRVLYYATRLIAGLSAGLLPFFVSSHPEISTGLSIAIVVMTIIDFVFNPKDRWKLFSRAADLLTIERLRAAGEYEGQAVLLDLLMATETAKLEQLVNIEDLIAKAKKTQAGV